MWPKGALPSNPILQSRKRGQRGGALPPRPGRGCRGRRSQCGALRAGVRGPGGSDAGARPPASQRPFPAPPWRTGARADRCSSGEDGDPQPGRRTRPLPSTQGSAPLTVAHGLGRGLRGLGGAGGGLRGGQSPVPAWPGGAAARGAGRDHRARGRARGAGAGAAANGGAGRRAGAMATANGGPGAGTSGGRRTSGLGAGSGTGCAEGGWGG